MNLTKKEQIEAAQKRFEEAIKRTRNWRDSLCHGADDRDEETADPPSHRRVAVKTG